MNHQKNYSFLLKTIFLLLLGFCLVFILILSFKRPISATGNTKWGITFSHTFAKQSGFDWEEIYIAMLDDLKPQILRVPVYWPEVEKEEGKMNFEDYDFMIREAEKRGVMVTLAVGMKAPRWPECHIPSWARSADGKLIKKDRLMLFVADAVKRYKDSKSLNAWQVENEPFLPFFGECGLPDPSLLDVEIGIVKSLDSQHKIIITDSGELSVWLPAAKRADIFGTTMYRIVWSQKFSRYVGYIKYPIPPKFFWFKANLVHLFYGNKPIIISELQAEPWALGSLYETPIQEQTMSLDIQKFKDNIEYAKQTDFPEAYLWGVEWWYWMKEKNHDPEFWNFAKETISASH